MALTACASVPGPPTSTTRSTPRPPVSSRTLSPQSGESRVSITSSTPISRRRAAFSGLDDVWHRNKRFGAHRLVLGQPSVTINDILYWHGIECPAEPIREEGVDDPVADFE